MVWEETPSVLWARWLLICICGLGLQGRCFGSCWAYALVWVAPHKEPLSEMDIDMIYFSFTKTAFESQGYCDMVLLQSCSHTCWTPGCLSPAMISTNGNSFAPLSVSVEVCSWLCFSLLQQRSEAKAKEGVCKRVQSWGNERGVCVPEISRKSFGCTIIFAHMLRISSSFPCSVFLYALAAAWCHYAHICWSVFAR